MTADKPGWRERRRAAKRDKAERTGDTPEKRADDDRTSKSPDAKGAASGAAIGGSVAAPTGIGGAASGGF